MNRGAVDGRLAPGEPVAKPTRCFVWVGFFFGTASVLWLAGETVDSSSPAVGIKS